MSFSADVDLPNARSAEASRRLVVGFLNWAHALDHFVLLIYPTVVIGLVVVYGRPYSELIAVSTAAFVAFGVVWIVHESNRQAGERRLDPLALVARHHQHRPRL